MYIFTSSLVPLYPLAFPTPHSSTPLRCVFFFRVILFVCPELTVAYFRSLRMKRVTASVSAMLCLGGGRTSNELCGSSRSAFGTSPLCEAKRGIKNLHQYPHARYKSLVKDSRRFSRAWYLHAGNNYELVDEKGHEREAFENFGTYRDNSANDKYLFSTNRLADLPPAKRLDALVAIMQDRWKVRDNNRGFDKAKLMLEALECFSEMRLSGQIGEFASLPEPDQDTFLQYVEGCAKFAQACSHSHPEAVAILIRAAQVCEDMRCEEKRDEVTHMAGIAANRMDRAYSFARPAERTVKLNPVSETESGAQYGMAMDKKLKEQFRDKPWVLEKKKRVEYMMGTRTRKVYLSPLKKGDCRARMTLLHEHHSMD